MIVDKDILSYFAALVEREIGILYRDSDVYQLETRLANYVRMRGLPSVEDLHKRFATGLARATEIQEFLELATNNETSFFRDPGLFRALGADIAPWGSSMLAPDQRLKVWSAAASTGQEAYSIAMTLEAYGNRHPLEFEILCTDFNEQVLSRARDGIYSALEVGRGLTPDQISRDFQRVDPADVAATGLGGATVPAGGVPSLAQTHYRVRPDLRSKLSFRQLNLLATFPFSDMFHVVFLRNMLIYQSVASRRGIIARVAERILPGGFLVLGATENLIGIDEGAFTQTQLSGAVAYRRAK